MEAKYHEEQKISFIKPLDEQPTYTIYIKHDNIYIGRDKAL
jgi:hypothetical protein